MPDDLTSMRRTAQQLRADRQLGLAMQLEKVIADHEAAARKAEPGAWKVIIDEISAQHGSISVPTDRGYDTLQHSGEHTVTLAGGRPGFGLSISATAWGPDAMAIAGWQAFVRLASAELSEGMVRRTEEWRRDGGEWRMVGCSESPR